MDRAYSNLRLRTIDEDQRIVEGIASTPRVDRTGDIVESLGALFDLPIPFLLDHDHKEAVGEVEQAEVTPTGIKFIARIKKIDEPGEAKNLVDKAWHFLKHGLRKSVSIGFRPIEYEVLPAGGIRYTAWDWLELSAVSVPAQADARITGTKGQRNIRLEPNRPTRVVKLSERDKRVGKIAADAKKRADARRRVGIPGKVVKL
jgi:HK97 family phage prohead protease